MRVAVLVCVLLAQAIAASQQPEPLRGRVLDAETGVPIQGARVVRAVASAQRGMPPLARTDADGWFEIPVGTPGLNVLTIVKAGYARVTLRLSSSGPVEVRLSRGASLTVTVVDQSGTPVPGRSLRLACGNTSESFPTDDLGEARVPHLPARGCEIALTPPEPGPLPQPLRGASPEEMRAFSDAARERAMRGMALQKAMPVTPLEFRPGEEVTLVLLDAPVNLPSELARDTGPVVRAVVPGRPGTASVRGRITDPAGRPAAGAGLLLGGDGVDVRVTTAETGQYEVAGLPAGRYVLQAGLAPYGVRSYGQQGTDGVSARGIVLEDGQQLGDVDIRFEARHLITGMVFDEHGQPAEGAIVTASPVDSPGMVRPAAGGFLLTVASPGVADDRGVYRIFALPDIYRVSATLGNDTTYHHPGNTSVNEALPVDLRAVPGVHGIDIVMGRALRVPLQGTVIRSSGAPATGGTVRLSGDDPGGAPYPPLQAAIDERGRFAFAGVAPGEYTLSAVSRPDPYVIVRQVNGQVVDDTPVPVAEYGRATVSIGVGAPTDMTIRTAPASPDDSR